MKAGSKQQVGSGLKEGDRCEDVWDLLSVYADGEATQQEAATVERHLAACSLCARDLSFLRAAAVSLASAPAAEPPASLRGAIRAATTGKARRAPRLRELLSARFGSVPFRAGAIATAGAAAGLWFLSLQRPPEPSDLPDSADKSGQPVVASVGSGAGPNSGTLGTAPVRPAMARFGAGARPSGSRSVTLSPAFERKPLQVRPGGAIRVASNPPKPLSTGPMGRPETKAPELELMPALDPVEPSPIPEPASPAPRTMIATYAPGPEPLPATSRRDEAGGPARIVMVAAAPGPAPGQIATLADLKRDLRSAQAERGTPVVRDDLRPGQIRVDVVKGSF